MLVSMRAQFAEESAYIEALREAQRAARLEALAEQERMRREQAAAVFAAKAEDAATAMDFIRVLSQEEMHKDAYYRSVSIAAVVR